MSPPPTVTWNTPLNQETVWGTRVELSVTVTGVVTKVSFLLDGTLLKQFSPLPNPASYVMYWNATKVSVGSHILSAVAYSGVQVTKTIVVSVSPTALTCQALEIEVTNEATTNQGLSFY